MEKFPRRGEIWWVSLDPTKGSEIKKTRPCVVLSRDEYNRVASTLTIVPITSGNVRYQAWEVELDETTGLEAVSHLVLPQIRVASKERLKKKIGEISLAHFSEIEEKLFFYLGFDGFLQQQSGGLTIITSGPGSE